jgi:hypothetical protein
MTKRKERIEGAIVLALGVVFLILALMIRNNPIKLKGWVNIVAQAKFLPSVIAVVVIVLGVKMLIDAFRKPAVSADQVSKVKQIEIEGVVDNNPEDKSTSQFEPNAWITVLIIIGYFALLPLVGFRIATALFIPCILLFLNLKNNKLIIIISVSAIFYVATMFVTPLVLGLRIN